MLLLNYCIPCIERYTMEIKNGSLYLVLKQQTPDIKTEENSLSKEENSLSKEEFLSKDFSNSTVLECQIQNDKNEILHYKNLKYINILKCIWYNIDDRFEKSFFKNNTTFNCSMTNIGKGYKYDETLNLYIQSKCANGTIKEIIHMITILKFHINISIKLNDDSTIYYKM